MHETTSAITSIVVHFQTVEPLGSFLQTFRKLQETIELCHGLRTSDQMFADLVGAEWVSVFVFLEDEERLRQKCLLLEHQL